MTLFQMAGGDLTQIQAGMDMEYLDFVKFVLINNYLSKQK